MSDCTRIRELIPWYANGTLTDGETREVTAHLATCEACQEELALTLRLKGKAEDELRRLPGMSEQSWKRVAAEAFGRPIGKIDVGSFVLGFSMGAYKRQGGIPVYGDLKILGRKVRLFSVGQEDET